MSKLLQSFRVIFWREIKWMNKNKEYWFLTLFGPLIGFTLILGIFNRGVVRDLNITIVDNDNTKTSRQLVKMIDATPIAKVKYRTPILSEAHDLMLRGKSDAIIDIKKGLERSILSKSTDAKTVIYLNGANVLKGSLLKSGILQAVSTFNAGIQVQIAMKKGENFKQAVVKAQPIRGDAHALFNPYTNYFYFLATVLMPLILVLFTLIGSVYSLGNELRNGTAGKALKKAENSIVVLTTGKLLPYTLLFTVHAIAFNYVIFRLMGFPLKGSFAVVVISEILMILAYQSIAVLLVGVLGNLRLSVSLGSAYSILALTFSGLTFPLLSMPILAQMFSGIFPLTYWLRIFLGETLRNDPIRTVMPQMLYFFVFITVGIVSMFWLRLRYSTPKHWKKL
ncbi:MAG: multidrug ABC transporter permease [Bacteroidia bacterium]|nr:MAG: multidrug ABC transporter permease [Bacteroidia bacterium]